ncbi:hypothetical protein HMPREF0262_00533 [Clostridium sp. ATCC 29733]|nr:hypothetical protein HMPREF0262_00533 [Clostridium sp. ATCC 29733]
MSIYGTKKAGKWNITPDAICRNQEILSFSFLRVICNQYGSFALPVHLALVCSKRNIYRSS